MASTQRIPKYTPKPENYMPLPDEDPEVFAERVAAYWIPRMPPGALESLCDKWLKLNDDAITVPPAFQSLYTPARYKVFYGGRGGAKCLKLGTLVIMADATLRPVESVIVGDQVMGPDGLPRTVLDTTRGYGDLYRIHQTSGKDYVVNADHILSLKKSESAKKFSRIYEPTGNERNPNGRYPSWPDITNIPVVDALKQSRRWMEHFRGYKADTIQFPRQDVAIDPYILGVWLGDGTSSAVNVTTMDEEIISAIQAYTELHGGVLSEYGKGNGNKARTYCMKAKTGRVNPIWRKFIGYGLMNNKHVPHCYIANDEQIRLSLLAGFIDTDGSVHNGCYAVAQKNERLICEIKLIADTLGFRTRLRKNTVTCGNNGKRCQAFKLSICGDLWRIPCRVKRKIITEASVSKNKDWRLSMVSITPEGQGEYAGFALDGDHLFLLEDGTVTHNSWSFARVLVKRAARESLRILCTREFQSSIADSVYRLICDVIQSTGLSDLFEITQTSITSTSGSIFIFKGLRRSIQEIKSMEGINICWVEEAQTISNNSWEILIPTIRQSGSQIWISFNPEEESDPTYQRFIINTPPDTIKVKVGWEDNPHFPAVLDAERQYMLSVDPEAYAHVWGGECRRISDAVIFRGRFEIGDFPPPPEGTRLYYGADWGFSVDPTALSRSFILDNTLYIDHEAYGVGVELDDIHRLFAQVPDADKWPILADASRPETISHVRRKGFNVSAAPKWSGSVEDGIAVLKGFRKIMIHERCKHTAEEFRLYSYKTDPLTNDILPIIVDKHNHCFIGDTLVRTINGDVPIKDISVGDLVLTRIGYKRVVKKFDNGLKTVNKYTFANGQSLTATDTHDIMTPLGKIKIKDITDKDQIYVLLNGGNQWAKIRNARRSYLRASLLEGIRTAKDVATEFIIDSLGLREWRKIYISTLPFGNLLMDPYRQGFISTTWTETHLTTTSLTFNSSGEDVTLLDIPISITNRIGSRLNSILQILGRSQKNGTQVKQGMNGIKNTLKRWRIIFNPKNIFASNAGNNSLKNPAGQTSSAQTLVSRHGEGSKGLTTKQESVPSAISNSLPINTANKRVALNHVPERKERVYDLMIEDQHEYFANGILVSNCVDALRYALSGYIKSSNFFDGCDYE